MSHLFVFLEENKSRPHPFPLEMLQAMNGSSVSIVFVFSLTIKATPGARLSI